MASPRMRDAACGRRKLRLAAGACRIASGSCSASRLAKRSGCAAFAGPRIYTEHYAGGHSRDIAAQLRALMPYEQRTLCDRPGQAAAPIRAMRERWRNTFLARVAGAGWQPILSGCVRLQRVRRYQGVASAPIWSDRCCVLTAVVGRLRRCVLGRGKGSGAGGGRTGGVRRRLGRPAAAAARGDGG